MKLLAEKQSKIYGAIAIDAPSGFSAPFPWIPFPCLIWDHDGRFAAPQRATVAETLLQAGCRYAVCGGHNCEAWHDAIDTEFVQQHLEDSDDVCETAHVMTTWHADETPDDVACFFVQNTNFDHHDFTQYLVLHVGDGRLRPEVDAAVRRYALGDAAV